MSNGFSLRCLNIIITKTDYPMNAVWFPIGLIRAFHTLHQLHLIAKNHILIPYDSMTELDYIFFKRTI